MATFRGIDGSATYATVAIGEHVTWSFDSGVAVIDETAKGDNHQQVKGGIASGTATIATNLDYVTGQQDLIDFIANATPAGTPGTLVVLVETGKSFSVSALFTGFSINSPEPSSTTPVTATYNFVLSGAITVAWV